MLNLYSLLCVALAVLDRCVALTPEPDYETIISYTYWGRNSVSPVPTQSSTLWRPCNRTSTSHTKVTVTGGTWPSCKPTITVTWTVSTTKTIKLPTSKGFIPVKTSLPGSTGDKKKRHLENERVIGRKADVQESSSPSDEKIDQRYAYPQRVEVRDYRYKCNIIIRTHTNTHTKCAGPAPTTKTIASKKTNWSTAINYAACDSKSHNSGIGIQAERNWFAEFTNYSTITTPAGSQYGLITAATFGDVRCCFAAFALQDTGVMFFDSTYFINATEPGPDVCRIWTDSTCHGPRRNPPGVHAAGVADDRVESSYARVGNGYCGQFDSACWTDNGGKKTCGLK